MSQPSSILDWVEARVADVQTREFENSFLSIGPSKPLGGLGFASPWRAFWWAVRHWRLLRDPRFGCFFTRSFSTWWVYAWHRDGLASVLEQPRHTETLREQGWPTGGSLQNMVQCIRAEAVPPKTALYDLIADCYGDKFNPGRTDVMPQVDPQTLLDAYFRSTGTADPSTVYFHLAAE